MAGVASGGRLIVALDQPSLAKALRVATRLRGVVRIVKIGSILFTAEGPEAIRRVRALGFEVMLDLKFFDIPSTVEASMRAAVRHRARLVTLHASGGPAMLKAAVAAAHSEARRLRVPRPRLLAVTVLTSQDAGRARATQARVLQLAQQARAAGCDGVVASAQEARRLRARLGRNALIVCPGIRPAGAARQDQARIAEPRAALAAGADLLVVGRPVTDASDPAQAARQIQATMEGA